MKISRILKSIKDGSFKSRIQKHILIWLGVATHEEELRTLHYFLTQFHSATDLPPTNDPDLRLLQLCDATELGIFDKICAKHGFEYWLDYGTLLGAYRHHGFIPWDDDTDIVMPRVFYDRLGELKGELSSLGFTLDDMNGRFVLGYNSEKTGIWADIFCMEEYLAKGMYDDIVEDVKSKRLQLQKKTFNLERYDVLQYKALKDNHFVNQENPDSVILYHAISLGAEHDIYDNSFIHPLQKINFEGYKLNAPCNIEKCLSICYGSNYMSLPRRGPESHSVSQLPLKYRAFSNGLDLNLIYKELLSVYSSL